MSRQTCLVTMYKFISLYVFTVYGLADGAAQNGPSGCVLPPYPPHGTYTVYEKPDAVPGQTYDFAILTVSCDPGYGVVGRNGTHCFSANIWLHPLPQCTPRMPPKVEIWPPGEQAIGVGYEFELHCRVLDGKPPPEIIWSRSDGRRLKPYTHVERGVLKFDRTEVTDEGQYICTATNLAGQASANATIKVRSVPVITLTPGSSVEVNPGERVDVECRASGYPVPMVSMMRKNIGELVPASPGIASLHIDAASEHDDGDYACTAVSAAGTVEEQFTVRVESVDGGFGSYDYEGSGEHDDDSPHSAREMAAVEGQDQRLGCIVSDNSYTVRWSRVGQQLQANAQQVGDELIIRNATKSDNGEYECAVVNRETSNPIRSAYIALLVMAQPRINILLPKNIRPGDSITVECIVQGDDITDISWKSVERPLSSRVEIQGSTLVFREIEVEDAGKYECSAKNKVATASAAAQVIISGGPSYPVNRRDEQYTARLGDRVHIPCRNNLEQPVSYEWRSEFSSLPSDVRSNEPNLYLHNVSEAHAGTYVCTVSNGRTRTQSRVVLLVAGVVPKFNGNSWLTMETLDAYLKFDMEISFKPTDPNGLILYNSQNEGPSGDFIALQLVNSVPQMVLELSGSTLIVKGDRPLHLNTWHTVRLSRVNAKVSMNVDGDGPFQSELPNKLQAMELKQPLYIGGVPDYNQLPAVLPHPTGFIGCVGMLILGHQEKDIMMDSIIRTQVDGCDSCSPNLCLHDGICQEARNERGYVCLCPAGFAGRDCDHAGEGCRPRICGPGKCTETANSYKCSCPITFTGSHCNIQQSIEYPAFTGSAYLAIKTPETGRSLTMSMKIKAMSPVTDGIIMYCAQSDLGNGGFISLTVCKGQLEFRYQLGDGSNPVILTSRYPLPANEWTKVNITRTGNIILLLVNQNDDIREGTLEYPKELHLTTPLYVGGVDDSNIILNNNTGVTGGFSGCIKDVTVQANPVNIVTASIESNSVTECTNYEHGDIDEE